MNTPTIHQINAMSKEDVRALNRKMTKRLALHMGGMLFFKIAVAGVLRTVAKKAMIEAAKRA